MTLNFRSTQVASPLTAPTSNNNGTGYFVRHRRVNLDGGVSLWSTALQVINAPVTLTPEAYSDTTNLLRDEFLISTDNLTYYIIPRSGTQTGAQTVNSITLGSWTVAVNEDTQNSVLTNLNFGTFTSSNNPFKRFYLVNDGGSVGSLTFNFTDSTTDQVAVDYSGLIQVEIEGVFSEYSQSPTTLYNQSFIWQTPPTNLNTLGLVLPSNGFVKLKVTLLNFPVGGQLENSVNLSMQVVENQQVFPLSYDSNWALNTFLYNPSMGFDYPFIEVTNSGTTLTLKPFLININGVLVGRFQSTSYTLPSTGTYYITIGNSGNIKTYTSLIEPPINETIIAIIETQATSPQLSYLYMFIGAKPDSYGTANDSIELGYFAGYFAKLDPINPDNLTTTNDLSNAVGIYLENKFNNSFLNTAIEGKVIYAKSGAAIVVTYDPTVVKGDILTVGTDGSAIKSATGCLVALSDFKDFYVLVDIKPFPTGSTSSLLASQVAVDTTGFSVISATELQDFSAKVDAALDKARTTGVSNGGDVNIEGGNTTFSVSAGRGQIYDQTSPTPVYYAVTWGSATGLIPLGNGLNWVYVSNAGTITVTQTEPSEALLKTRLYLARLTVESGTISSVTPLVILTKQYAARLNQLAKVLGTKRLKSNQLLPVPSGTNLKLKITAGSLYSPSSNYPDVTDVDSISYDIFDTGVGDTFYYILPNGTKPTGNITDLQVAYYAPGGVWTLIPEASSRIGVHYVWQLPGKQHRIVITPGRSFYTTVQSAIAALTDIEALATAPSEFSEAFLYGAILATKSETNLNNSTFVYTTDLGNFSGSVATVGGATSLQTAYVNGSEITTNSTNGAVVVKRGSTLDTDTIIEGKNGAGTTTFSVKGDGSATTPTATFGTNNTTVANTAFVQAALAAITKGLTIVQTSATTLSPTTGNYYLATGTTTVNLPAGNNGDIIGIADGSSNFGTVNCTINPNGAQTIAGETSVKLTADNAHIVLAFWGTRWTVVYGNSFIPVSEDRPTNILVNGAFTIDQRNNGSIQTITAAAAKAYTVDEWYAYCTGANVTGQRVAGSGQSRYRYRFTGATGNTAIQFGQRIDAASSYHLNGQTCTLSVDLSSTSITTVTWTAFYANSTDAFGTIASPTRTQIATGTFTGITSTIARYSTQISIPLAATTGIEIVFSVGALLGSQTWTIGNAQLEKGAFATNFEYQDPKDTRLICMARYQILKGFHRSFDSTLGAGTGVTHRWSERYPVPMVSVPAATLTNTSGSNYNSLSISDVTTENIRITLSWLTDGVVARSMTTDIILDATL